MPAPGPTANRQWTPRRLGHSVELPQGVPDRIQSLEDIQLVQVDSGEDQHLRIFNELILTEHPLHEARLVGRQLRYLIGSPYGWLGAIGLGASALCLKSRDQWMGWDESQRAKHHERVINLTRFLIRPSVRCETLASYVLGLCARRVANDFHRRYGIEPWLLETFVDQTQYAGTCFQAANWIDVGQTQGRGRNGKVDRRPIEEKEIYGWVQTYEDACTIASELSTTHCVCIGDRESDRFELFDRRRRQGGSVDLLVRAKHERWLEEEEKK